MVTTACTPTAAARSTIAVTLGVVAPQASRWVWASTNGVSGSGAGGGGRLELTAHNKVRQMSEPYYITTAIAYPNGDPHVGHAYEYIATDAIARFKRLDGFDVRFLTGTDVHGQKMAETAAAEGIPTAELARRNSDVFQRLQEKLNISFDRFIRTSDADHYEASKEIWRRMNEAATSTWTRTRAGTRCATSASSPRPKPPSARRRADRHRDRRTGDVDRGADLLLPAVRPMRTSCWRTTRRTRVHRARRAAQRGGQLRLGGLRDFSISRTTFDWGVPVPDHPDHVMYVWVDALTNYLTGVGFPTRRRSCSSGSGPPICT